MKFENDRTVSLNDDTFGSIYTTEQRLGRGEINADTLAEQCLDRATALESAVGAWIHLDPEHVRAQTRALQHQLPHRALHAIPVGVKDVFDTADAPTGYGSPIYNDYHPIDDAIAVQRLRAAGAIIFGKTVTTEFAHSYPGKTRNPHGLEHTPGGSSSGSAAAVAAGLVVAAIGTQTSGSVIRPASFCGVIGFKPTFGRIPTTGIRALAKSLDTVGVFARSVENAATVTHVLCNDEVSAKRELSAQKPNKIGICRTEYWNERDAGMDRAFDATAAALRDTDIALQDVELPPVCRGLNAVQELIYVHEASIEFDGHMLHSPDRLSSDMRELITAGRQVTEMQYRDALDKAIEARAAFKQIMKSFDLLLTPSAPGEAPSGLRKTGNPVFNRLWTLLHAPCLSLPLAQGPRGLPIGMQFIGAVMNDDAVLSHGHWLWQQLR